MSEIVAWSAVETVARLHASVMANPWSPRNFHDSLAGGHACTILEVDGEVAACMVARHLAPETGGIREVLASQMNQPTFPVPIDIMQAQLSFEDFTAGDVLNLGPDVRVTTTPLNHPDGATGYRVDHNGHAFCYVTDTEHVPGKPDERILALIEGADIVVYDCTYNDKEFASKVGWGHSTWQEGMRLCQAANVRQHVIFHHDPDHEDIYMERLEEEARYEWIGNTVARENMRLRVG